MRLWKIIKKIHNPPTLPVNLIGGKGCPGRREICCRLGWTVWGAFDRMKFTSMEMFSNGFYTYAFLAVAFAMGTIVINGCPSGKVNGVIRFSLWCYPFYVGNLFAGVYGFAARETVLPDPHERVGDFGHGQRTATYPT